MSNINSTWGDYVMGININTNIPALNAKNTLRKNIKNKNSAMKKLVSGLKINKAADDASGLSVTKSMKAQITALETVNENNGDSINLVQTTEGYISEIQEMVSRMTELAAKSANGVLAQEDRDALQYEMDHLCAEIDRLSSTANFNGIKLLNGDPTRLSDNYTQYHFTITDNNLFINGKDGNQTVKELDNAVQQYHGGDLSNLQGKKLYWTETGVIRISDTLPDDIKNSGSAYDSVYISLFRDVIVDKLNLQIGETSTCADRLIFNLYDFHTDSLLSPTYDSIQTGQTTVTSTPTYGVQGNTTSSSTNQTTGGTNTVNTYTSVLNGAFKSNTDTSVYYNAISFNISDPEYAISNIESVRALSIKISSIRGEYGAVQNRLDHTINNLSTTVINLSEANSRIADTDMANSSLRFLQYKILEESTQSMFAQANSQPQTVLSLLQ